MMKINSKSKQLEMDFTFENISNTNNHMSISRLNEIRMNSRKIFKNNYNKEKNRRELISYIIQNEKSF